MGYLARSLFTPGHQHTLIWPGMHTAALHSLKMKQIDLLILGCTHYPLLKDVIQAKIGKRVKVIDSSEALSKSIKQFFTEHHDMAESLSKTGNHRYMVSDVTEHMQRLASRILKSSIKLEIKRF